jgi:hypothetical protein
MTARYWLLTLVLTFQVGRLALNADQHSLPLLLAAGVVFFRGTVAANAGVWWEPMLRLSMGVPVRLRVLAARAFADKFGMDLLIDGAAAALGVVLTGSPLWVGPVVVIAFQLVRVSSYLRMWLRLTRGKGKLGDVTLYMGLELVLYAIVFIALIFDTVERNTVKLTFEPTPYIALLVVGAFVIILGLMTLWWRYRRADTSHMRNGLATWGE